MQEATASSLAAAMPNDGDTTTLVDSRTGENYSIAKILGRYLMTKNLMLGVPIAIQLTQDDSNVSSSGYTLPASSIDGFSSSTAENVYNSGSTDCSSSNGCYAYYTWKAATAGSTKSSGTADYDICPKGWRIPTQSESINLVNAYPTSAALTAAPFLGVYNGLYSSSQFSDGGTAGRYWSSTARDSTSAYRLSFASSSAGVNYDYKGFGYAIRCVKKEPTMQDATTSSLASAMPNDGDTTVLSDSRNNEEYSIAKINGQYWMTKNLMLGGSSTIQLTQDDSNVSSSGYTLPASSTSGFSDNTAANVYNSGSTTCSSTSACYAYYTWKAATAGSTKSSGAADYDICPKGWRLPTQAEFDALTSSYDTGPKLVAAPFLGVYNGRYDSSQFKLGGSRGFYWSSTANSSTYAYRLSFNSSSADTTNIYKRYGSAVRCIFKS